MESAGFFVLALLGECIWKVRGLAQNLTAESLFAPCQPPFVAALLRYTSFGVTRSCGFQHHWGLQHSRVLRSSVWGMSPVVTSSVSGHSALRGREPDALSRGVPLFSISFPQQTLDGSSFQNLTSPWLRLRTLFKNQPLMCFISLLFLGSHSKSSGL